MIISNLQKYYLKHVGFFESFLETSIKLFCEHNEKIIDLVTVEQKHSKMKYADPVEGDTLK